ncbi:hypothetical protein E4U42_007411 [Claviceps africana]|uniref:NmrA-like domain-containing protein n=1 Tax=Claviceps africana TaxID=83212 RepID=A0A8K0J311_9HYPO|nr:hypothetical protein E4U42_007411 [Claviceps africana]
MSKILTVFGATGNQGGSVIRAVLADEVLSREFTVRGVTRDVDKPAARALAAQGVEMVQPGFFMSNLLGFIRKSPDGLVWPMPEGVSLHEAQLPLLDAARDTGLFVKAAMKHFPDTAGTRILAATDYYSPARIVAELQEVTGKKVSYVETPHDVFKESLPGSAAQEMLENMLLLQDPGYYAGADLRPSLQLLDPDDKPVTWKAFAQQNKDKWE